MNRMSGRIGSDCLKIYVDADACPVIKIVERIAKKHSDYSEVVIVGAGADAVDFKLVSLIKKGDICVAQDYGVAAMILSKGAYGIHQSGKWYTNENMDELLLQRHIAKKVRRSSKKNYLKGPAKRTKEDDLHFEESLERLIKTYGKANEEEMGLEPWRELEDESVGYDKSDLPFN